MKVRKGFVSNSSSSSFVIASKHPLTAKNREAILNSFRIPKESPFFCVADKITDLIMRAEEVTLREHYSEDEHIPFFSDDELETMAKNGFKFYVGSASNESGHIEELLCEMDLDVETEDFRLIKEGGY